MVTSANPTSIPSTLSIAAQERMASMALLPELHHALDALLQADTIRLRQGGLWQVIPVLRSLFGDTTALLTPFHHAWVILYSATSRLDHLQDRDPDDTLHTKPAVLSYNLLLSYAMLATSMLDNVDSRVIPPLRIARLRRLWSDAIIRMASGQHRDLVQPHDTPSFAAYQQLAQAKTGAMFTLAFGGCAILMSDDEAVITPLLMIGEIYGTLIQYSDDTLDAPHQAHHAWTLPTVLNATYGAESLHTMGHSVAGLWFHVYHAYRDQVAELVQPLPSPLQHGILDLFCTTFEHLPA